MAPPDPIDALVDACFDGRYDQVHAPVRALLLDPCFDRREGLTASENGHLAYQRARFVGTRSVPPSVAAGRIHDLCALAEWPGLCDVSVFSILMVHYNLTVGTVVDRMRPGPLTEQALAALDRFEAFGPYLATELGYGNNVASLRTLASYDPDSDGFVLRTPCPQAAKYMSYSGFADIDKIAVVLARTVVAGRDVGVFPFLVPLTADGSAVAGIDRAPCPEKPVQGLDNGITWFRDRYVPRQAWLSRGLGDLSPSGEFVPELTNPHRRFLAAMSRIVPGRLCVSSAALGAAKASLYLAATFSRHRLANAPGRRRPVRDFLQYKSEVYPALARTYALIAQVNELKARYEAAPDLVALQAEISATKAVTTLAAQDVVATCRERCGAQGMFSINRISDYVSLLQGLVTAEGDSQVLLGTTAVQLLHADAWSAPEPSPGDAAIDPTADGSPGAAADGAGGAAVDAAVGLLARRSALIAARYHDQRRTADNELPAFDAMNRGLPVALDFGAAWVTARAARALCRLAARTAHPRARCALARLVELFALGELLRDHVDLLVAGEVTAVQVAGWRERSLDLCQELDDDVDDLVAAFRLDGALLRAPLAEPDHTGAFLVACAEPLVSR
ncbi:MAG TPA: acyl-CoA dehydrogenase family protein [Kineosporiaceae bacterium]